MSGMRHIHFLVQFWEWFLGYMIFIHLKNKVPNRGSYGSSFCFQVKVKKTMSMVVVGVLLLIIMLLLLVVVVLMCVCVPDLFLDTLWWWVPVLGWKGRGTFSHVDTESSSTQWMSGNSHPCMYISTVSNLMPFWRLMTGTPSRWPEHETHCIWQSACHTSISSVSTGARNHEDPCLVV